jgi:hypothetical protein
VKTPTEHWVQSGKAKTAEIQNIAREFVSRLSRPDYHEREDEIRHQLTQLEQKTTAFFDHFGPGQVPPALQQFAHALQLWKGNRQNPQHIIALVTAYNQLSGIGSYDATTVTFQVILDGFRNDQELEKLLADLVTKLRNLVNVADADLSAKIARELNQVLDELDRRAGKTLTDLLVWLDLGMKGLAELARLHGFEQAPLAYECAKAAVSSKLRILAIWEKAENDFQLKLGFSFLKKAAKEVPDIRSEEDFKRYLPPPSNALPGKQE